MYNEEAPDAVDVQPPHEARKKAPRSFPWILLVAGVIVAAVLMAAITISTVPLSIVTASSKNR